MRGTKLNLSSEDLYKTRFLGKSDGGEIGGNLNVGNTFIFEHDLYIVTKNMYDFDQQCWVVYGSMVSVEN